MSVLSEEIGKKDAPGRKSGAQAIVPDKIRQYSKRKKHEIKTDEKGGSGNMKKGLIGKIAMLLAGIIIGIYIGYNSYFAISEPMCYAEGLRMYIQRILGVC